MRSPLDKSKKQSDKLTRGQKNILMADQMFKDAFLVKKTRFSKLHPELSDEDLNKMTAQYFRELNERES
ncbi:MAG: hypothetical protein H6626_14405 [Pseudobdellovibrionaceae bacterium]|nr:MAG: hypothetical protein H6626_14405 [Pseudobdellovibrionaceae bacterium]